jgi:hypothetical protein
VPCVNGKSCVYLCTARIVLACSLLRLLSPCLQRYAQCWAGDLERQSVSGGRNESLSARRWRLAGLSCQAGRVLRRLCRNRTLFAVSASTCSRQRCGRRTGCPARRKSLTSALYTIEMLRNGACTCCDLCRRSSWAAAVAYRHAESPLTEKFMCYLGFTCSLWCMMLTGRTGIASA